MWQLGQIYTSDVKISSVYVETEQTSRVSALVDDLPERLWSCCFHCLIIKFSVVMIFGSIVLNYCLLSGSSQIKDEKWSSNAEFLKSIWYYAFDSARE